LVVGFGLGFVVVTCGAGFAGDGLGTTLVAAALVGAAAGAALVGVSTAGSSTGTAVVGVGTTASARAVWLVAGLAGSPARDPMMAVPPRQNAMTPRTDRAILFEVLIFFFAGDGVIG
jgi:hypothetical protein